MKSFIFGETESNLPIQGFDFGNSGPHILILGGVHGDELEGVALAKYLWADFFKSFPYKIKLTLVPEFNLDGVLAGTRHNLNGVDLNRNLPTKDWDPKAFTPRYFPGKLAGSESENKALIKFIAENKLNFIISLHSFSRFLMNINGDCRKEAEIMEAITAYPIDESMGYPTPGCLGTYTGLERNIPTITYELKRGQDLKSLLPIHARAIKEAIKFISHTR